MLARVIQDPSISRPTATATLPMLSFEMGKMSYDGSRKLHTVGRSVTGDPSDKNSFKYQYNPVPYNINFKVYVYVKNAEDGTKIVEQILPFFTPDWTTSVNLIPEVDITMDIPIILNNIDYQDTYDEAFTDRRAIIWTLDLTLKGYIYGPVKRTGIIKFASTNFYIPSVPDGQISTAIGKSKREVLITNQPGLTANGQPTDNINLTIPYNQISANDDFGFITQITETGN